MDAQHGVLMDALNEVRLIAMRGAGREKISDDLDRLLHLTRMHFTSEEQLLEQQEFPSLTVHQCAHEEVLKQLREAGRRTRHSESVELRSLLESLHRCFMEHFEQMDQQYGAWLNRRGVV